MDTEYIVRRFHKLERRIEALEEGLPPAGTGVKAQPKPVPLTIYRCRKCQQFPYWYALGTADQVWYLRCPVCDQGSGTHATLEEALDTWNQHNG